MSFDPWAPLDVPDICITMLILDVLVLVLKLKDISIKLPIHNFKILAEKLVLNTPVVGLFYLQGLQNMIVKFLLILHSAKFFSGSVAIGTAFIATAKILQSDVATSVK